MLENLDYRYVHNNLARPGYLALQNIKANHQANPELLSKIDNPVYGQMRATPLNFEKFWEEIHYRPEKFELPTAVVSIIEQPGFGGSFSIGVSGRGAESVLVKIDLDSDGEQEYVLIHLYNRGDGKQEIARSNYYYRDKGKWQTGSLSYSTANQGITTIFGANRMINQRRRPDFDTGAAIKSGDIELAQPRFDNFSLGGVVFHPL